MEKSHRLIVGKVVGIDQHTGNPHKADLLPCEKCYVIGYGPNWGTAVEDP